MGKRDDLSIFACIEVVLINVENEGRHLEKATGAIFSMEMENYLIFVHSKSDFYTEKLFLI